MAGRRGYKQCPKCKAALGVRTRQCPCGHEFPPPVKRGKKKNPARQAIVTPAPAPSVGPPVFKPTTAAPQSGPVVIRLTDFHDACNFCRQLDDAIKSARRSGGSYSAFVHLADSSLVQVECAFPITRAK